jgi:hypothetical protein
MNSKKEKTTATPPLFPSHFSLLTERGFVSSFIKYHINLTRRIAFPTKMMASIVHSIKLFMIVTILASFTTHAQIGQGDDFTPVDCDDSGVQDAAAYAFTIYTIQTDDTPPIYIGGGGKKVGKKAKKAGKKGGKKMAMRKAVVGSGVYTYKVFGAFQKVRFMIYNHLIGTL